MCPIGLCLGRLLGEPLPVSLISLGRGMSLPGDQETVILQLTPSASASVLPDVLWGPTLGVSIQPPVRLAKAFWCQNWAFPPIFKQGLAQATEDTHFHSTLVSQSSAPLDCHRLTTPASQSSGTLIGVGIRLALWKATAWLYPRFGGLVLGTRMTQMGSLERSRSWKRLCQRLVSINLGAGDTKVHGHEAE